MKKKLLFLAIIVGILAIGLLVYLQFILKLEVSPVWWTLAIIGTIIAAVNRIFVDYKPAPKSAKQKPTATQRNYLIPNRSRCA